MQGTLCDIWNFEVGVKAEGQVKSFSSIVQHISLKLQSYLKFLHSVQISLNKFNSKIIITPETSTATLKVFK